MQDKTAFITGATGGIGKWIARGLADLGATVLIGARDPDKGRAVATEITTATGNARVSVISLDVASLASIRALQLPKLDVLINNAGAWFSDRQTTADGHERTFATNVLGPHLVTKVALPRLAPGARIINIVSGFAGNYDATDLEYARRRYDGFKAYAQSKQALRMLTWGLAARLTGITANAVAPGFVRTDFNQNAHGPMAAIIGAMAKLFAVSPAKGADTAVWAASTPELAGVTGKLFEKRREKDGKFREADAIAELERQLDDGTTEGVPCIA
jgi:NAD(P)-dependent dehydrogenase (short-subunit alcohol dehydrogenase family)